MGQELWATDEIEVDVSGVFTAHHFLQTAAKTLGELTLPAFRSGGVFRAADGRELVVERTSWWRGRYQLREDGDVLATARPCGFWQRTMNIGFRGLMYQLVPAGFWSRGWHLLDGTGTMMLEIQPRGTFRRGAYVAIRGPVDADLLVFAYYLVNVRWQEHAAAAGAAAGS